MATFNLTAGGKSLTLDTNGTVVGADGSAAGTWSTNNSNQIVIKKGSVSVTADVEWLFNEKNQLALAQGGATVFNFSSGGLRPRVRLVDNCLQVRPSGNFSFDFTLTPAWSLSDKLVLQVTLGPRTSNIDGWVDDKKSRFIYWFRDKSGSGAPFLLEFRGEWSRDETPASSGEIRLDFDFKVGTKATRFSLPDKALVNLERNHLFFEYAKDGLTRRLEFRGSVEINENLDVVFTISRQTNAANQEVVSETRVELSAKFEYTDFSGSLDLFVVKQDGSLGQKLTLGGEFSATIGDKGLAIGFLYSKTSDSGGRGELQLAVNGRFTWDGGKNQLVLSYERKGKTETLKIGANFLLGKARLEAGLNVTKDGKTFGVYGFLGISF